MSVDSVASRASSYGFGGVTVDGTDMIAVYEAVRAAAERARAGQGPTLVEAMVERLLPHTTDDDHTRYRPRDDLEAMKRRDPVEITKTALIRRGLLTEQRDAELRGEARKTVDAVNEEVEAMSYPSVDTMFDHVFGPEQPSWRK
jgi:2-oxoisovalerate dehydrogenase E1 component alpha subunit